MIISSSRDQLVSTRGQFRRQGLCVLERLLRVGLEFRRRSFLQCDRDSGDGIHMRSALHAGEYCPIDPGRNIFDGVFRFLQWIANDSLA